MCQTGLNVALAGDIENMERFLTLEKVRILDASVMCFDDNLVCANAYSFREILQSKDFSNWKQRLRRPPIPIQGCKSSDVNSTHDNK